MQASIAFSRLRNTLAGALLLGALTGLLITLGYALAGEPGMLVFAGLAVLVNLALFWFSAPLALRMAGAVEVDAQEAPNLHAMVARLAWRAGIPKPRVYLTPAAQPNAFATGRSPASAAVAVTQGLLQALPARELEGVLAHEIAHIRHRDILLSSVAAAIAGAISALADAMGLSLLFGGGEDEQGGGLLGTLPAILLAPLAALVLQLAISRQREYVADAAGAELVGDPGPLADALVRLERAAQLVPMPVNAGTAPLYIINPLAALRGGWMVKLLSTHPPTEDRVARLRSIQRVGRRRLAFGV